MDLMSIALQFALAVLLAFLGFVLRALVQRTDSMHAAVQALEQAVAGIAAQIADLGERISRLERVQDEDNRDRKQT